MDYKEKYLKYKKKYTELKNSLYGGNQKQEQEQNVEINNALITAIENNNIEEVRELLDRGANVNHTIRWDQTPLIVAALKYRPDLDIINILLERGADVNHKDKTNNTALMYAIEFNKIEVARKLLKGDVNINDENNENALIKLINSRKEYDMIKFLLDNGMEYDFEKYNSDEINYKHFNSFINNGIIDIVELFLVRGANPNCSKFEYTPLITAIINNNYELAELLLNNGADPNRTRGRDYETTPIFYAIENNNIELVRLLIERGANINWEDDNNRTPLELAMIRNHNIRNSLIVRGVDINREDDNNRTLLELVMIRNRDIRNLLIDRNAELSDHAGVELETELIELRRELDRINAEMVLNEMKLPEDMINYIKGFF
jgi:ankyrin repeat protein